MERAHEVFFILGRGRSGTTLLGRMLARHPALEVAPEGFFALNLARRYRLGPWSDERIEGFCRDLLLENRMKTWNLDIQDIRARLKANLSRLDYAQACRIVYGSYAAVTRGRQKVRWVGDKNPHYGLFPNRLLSLFPAARFIHIVRDPRDNVLSYKQVPFDIDDTGALAYRWRRYNEEILAAARRQPTRFHRVTYEDLVERPEAVLAGICDSLGEPWDPAMLSFHEERQPEFYGAKSAWFDNLTRPVDPAQARKWSTALSPAEVGLIESICAPLMQELGYPRAADGVGTNARAALGMAMGWGSVTMEKLVFGSVPAEWRTWLINRYRSRSGRV